MSDFLCQYLFSFLACFPFLKVCCPGCFPGRFFGLEAFPVLKDFRRYPVDGFFKGGFLELAFPNDYDGPAFGFQPAPDVLVPFLVPGDFGCPEVGVGFGDRVELAGFVTVPEAAVDEDYCPVLRKDNVWGAGEALVVHSVAETLLPESMAQPQLRFCGSGVDGGHVAMALGFRQCIRHMLRLKIQKYAFFIIFVS